MAEDEKAPDIYSQMPWHTHTPWWWLPELTTRVSSVQLRSSKRIVVKSSVRIPAAYTELDDDAVRKECWNDDWEEVGSGTTETEDSAEKHEWDHVQQKRDEAFFRIPILDEYDVAEVSDKMGGALIVEVKVPGFWGDDPVGQAVLSLNACKQHCPDPNSFVEGIELPLIANGGSEEVGKVVVSMRATRWSEAAQTQPGVQIEEGMFNVVTLSMPAHCRAKLSPGCALLMSPSVYLADAYVASGKAALLGGEDGVRVVMETRDKEGVLQVTADEVPGKVHAVTLEPDDAHSDRWVLCKGAWVAHAGSVRLRVARGAGISPWVNTLQQADGHGVLVFSGCGHVMTRTLGEGEEMMVDSGNLIAWQWKLGMGWAHLSGGGDIGDSALADEGWYARFRGPGTFAYSTRTMKTFKEETLLERAKREAIQGAAASALQCERHDDPKKT